MLDQNSSQPGPLTRVLGTALRTPMQAQTYRNLLYVVSMLVLGNLYVNVLVMGVGAALPLAFVGVGVALGLLVLALVVELAGFERMLVRYLLGVDVPASSAGTGRSRWERTKGLVTDRRTWNAVVYLLTEFVVGTAAFGVIASLVATGVSFLAAPFYYTRAPVVAYGPIPTSERSLELLFGWDSLLIGLETTFRLGSWHVETFVGALVVAGLGGVFLLVALLFSNAIASLWGRYARRMLTTPRLFESSG